MREFVYQNHDNLITLELQDDSSVSGVLEPSDLSGTTKVILDFCDGTVIDSSVETDVFDWSAGNGLLDMKLGHQGLDVGSYKTVLVIYDAVHTEGVRWSPELWIIVKEC